MRVVIIGMDRGIGKALGGALSRGGHQVSGTTRRRENVDDATLLLDLNNTNAIDVSLEEAEVVFFCAAETRYDVCASNPEVAHRVNAASPAAIAKKLVEKGARVVLLSTSAVLDCRSPRMTADRPRNPSSVYGRSKAEAERAFVQLGTSASILRLSKVLVPGMERFNKWIESLKQGNQIDCPDDLRFSPITIDQAVDGLIAISDQREGGLFQLSGDSDISYAEAARFIARKVGVTDRLVRARAAAELGIPAESVTAYTSLDTSRLNALYGFVAPAPFTVIDQILEPAPAPASSDVGRIQSTQI